MPLVQTRGAASAQGFGEFAQASAVNYIEDVFNTFLRLSDGTNTQAIVNNIDLSTKGGLVWSKPRVAAGENHIWVDSARGLNKYLSSDLTSAQGTMGVPYVFNTNGFTSANGNFWANGVSLVDWTFRKQPKFFDVVTYTGNGTYSQTVAHSLTSVPGAIFIKRTSSTADWRCLCKNGTDYSPLQLNTTGGDGGNLLPINACATSTTLNIGYIGLTTGTSEVNTNGETYVAYLFAHDAGGFGLTGTDNVISCGTYTTNGSGVATVNLGYEPQWVLTKATSGTFGTTDWVIADNMRGMPAPPQTDGVGGLFPNLANAEDNNFNRSVHPTSTGFVANQYNSTPYIYIAIRRGPMKVPTDATKVFVPVQYTSTGSPPVSVTTGFPVDMIIETIKGPAGQNRQVGDRLRGTSINVYRLLDTDNTGAENTGTFANSGYNLANNTGYQDGFISAIYGAGYNCITWNFRRAPSFFDEVCYTGTGVARTVAHNLAAVPEFMIVKNRTQASNWTIYTATTGNGYAMNFDTAVPFADGGVVWNSTSPTSAVFSVGTNDRVNGISANPVYVAYLFATCAGVSKVGSYTGAGVSQSIACGFTGGARFVLIKRTDSTGDWWLWDSSRGMVSGTDPRIGLNIQTGESNNNWVFTEAGGFQIVTTDASVNASGGSYIFLAIA